MTNREKVIQWLEACSTGCEPGCPYEYENMVHMVECKADLMRDARELLKAQKPTTVDVDAQAEPYWKATCGGCKEPLSLFAAPIIEVMNFAKYCPHCGRPLNWLPHKNKEEQE